MTCYTFSARPTIPESRNVKVAMKKIDEEKMKTFVKNSISTLRTLFLAKKKHFEKNFVQDGVSLAELKINFGKFL